MRRLATVFKALSDETRLAMLGLLLREGELCVCDFVEVLGITQSKASRHLRYLVHAGLLQDRRELTWVYYRMADQLGAEQRLVLSGVQELVKQQLPDELLESLKTWKQQKQCDGGCGPSPKKRLSSCRGRCEGTIVRPLALFENGIMKRSHRS